MITEPSHLDLVKQKILELFDGRNTLPKGFDPSIRCHVKSPLEFAFPTGAYDALPPLYSLGDEHRAAFFEVLKRSLSHHTVNPSQPGNVEVWKTIYAFGSTPDPSVAGSVLIANGNRQEVERFAKHLIQDALTLQHYRHQRHYNLGAADYSTESRHLAVKTRHILLGSKGTGKTTFLNYLLATCSELADRSHVIFVRLDCAEQPNSLTIEECLQRKLLRILFEYYDSGDNPALRARDHLHLDLSLSNRRLADRFQLAAGHIPEIQDFRRFKAAIRDKRDPGLDFPSYFRAILDYLTLDGIDGEGDSEQPRRFGFVYLIDNVDKLGLRPSDEEEYKKRIHELEVLLHEDDKLDAAVLIVMRNETYFELRRGPHWDARDYEVCGIHISSPEAIFDKRIDRMKRLELFGPDVGKQLGKMRREDYEVDVQALCNAYLDFVAYSLSYSLYGVGQTGKAKAFYYLERLFGVDRRFIFEALRDCAIHFLHTLPSDDFSRLIQESADIKLSQATEGRKWMTKATIHASIERRQTLFSKHYLITEALFIGRQRYLPDPYSYKIQPNGDGGYDVSHRQYHRLVPGYLYNIFSYPHSVTLKSRLMPLAGIRLLQWFGAAPDRCGYRDECLKFLCEYLLYDLSVLRILFDELVDFRLLGLTSVGLNEESGAYSLTDRGSHILDRYSQALEYVALALESTAVPRECVEAAGGEPALMIGEYGGEDYVVRNKIISAARFVGILKTIEDWERGTYLRVSIEKGTEVPCFEDTFAITAKIAQSVNAAIFRVVDSAYTQSNERLCGLIERALHVSRQG